MRFSAAALVAAFAGSASLYAAETLPLIQCDISKTGFGKTQTLTLQVHSEQCIDSSCNPVQTLAVGKRVVQLSSSGGKLAIFVVDQENSKTGPYVFFGTYASFDGAKDKGGFTGKISLLPETPGVEDYDQDRMVAFTCYRADAS